MLEGIGLQTIGGVLVTIITGKVTPLSCYVGLGPHSNTGTVDLPQPVGILGCEYDIETLRVFFDHHSSPATGKDWPGLNHVGIKYLFPRKHFTPYIGVSLELGSDLVHMDNPLGVIGVETNGNIRLFAEHLNSVISPNEGHTVAGVKFVF